MGGCVLVRSPGGWWLLQFGWKVLCKSQSSVPRVVL